MERKTSETLWHNGWVGLSCEHSDFHSQQLFYSMMYDNALYTIDLIM